MQQWLSFYNLIHLSLPLSIELQCKSTIKSKDKLRFKICKQKWWINDELMIIAIFDCDISNFLNQNNARYNYYHLIL